MSFDSPIVVMIVPEKKKALARSHWLMKVMLLLGSTPAPMASTTSWKETMETSSVIIRQLSQNQQFMSNNNKTGSKIVLPSPSTGFRERGCVGNAVVYKAPASRPCVSGGWNISRSGASNRCQHS